MSRTLWVGCVLCLIGACSSLGKKLVKPTITVLQVEPLKISVSKQQLRFTLKADNPNPVELPIAGVDFVAKFNNSNFASGKSKQSVTIPANGSGLISVDVSASVSQIADSIIGLLKSPRLEISYDVSGSIRIKNWGASVPFSINGIVDLVDELPAPPN